MYWARRQTLLAEQYHLDFGDDEIRAHEIEFYERFLAQGYVIDPIRIDPRRPMPDFHLQIAKDRVPVELKAVLLQPGETLAVRRLLRPVRGQIIRIEKFNRAHPSRGSEIPYFIVDLRNEALPAEYMADLSTVLAETCAPGIWVYANGDLIPVPGA